MKKVLLTLSISWIASGCVMSPDSTYYPAPNVDVGVGVDSDVNFHPRIYNGTRSNVTVWLHPSYTVADAYPIAQAHCSRWGFYARPSYDWTVSTSFERRLNYSCVTYRPVLSGPHIIVGSPFYRNHYRHWHGGRSYGRTAPRRGTFGRGTVRNNRRGTVYTPKPTPRHTTPSRRRGTFGRVFKPTTPAPSRTTVQRGKPWEHNVNKNKVVIPNPDTTVQRGKPWEHNANKGSLNNSSPRVTPKYKSKRSTFGSSGSGTVREKSTYKSKTSIGSGFGSRSVRSKSTFNNKSGFGSIRPKNSGRRSSKGKLTL